MRIINRHRLGHYRDVRGRSAPTDLPYIVGYAWDSGTTATDVTIPLIDVGTWAANDVLIVFLASSDAIAVHADFDELGNGLRTGGTYSNTYVSVQTRTLESGDTTFTFTNGGDMLAQAVVVRNVGATADQITFTDGTSGSLLFPTVTPTAPGQALFRYAAGDANVPTSYTNFAATDNILVHANINAGEIYSGLMWRPLASVDQVPTLTSALTGSGFGIGVTLLMELAVPSTDLVVADLIVTTTADTVTLTQDHTLAVADLTVATTIDTVTLTQEHTLAVADLTIASTIDTVTLTLPDVNLAYATVAAGFDAVSGFGEESGVNGHLGAGSPTTVTVTSTAATGAGSLYAALHGSLGDREVVFDESIHGSTIALTTNIEANGDNITLNAIGADITITGENLRFTGDNIIVAGLTITNTTATSDSLTFRRNSSEPSDQRALVYACLFDQSAAPADPDAILDVIWQRAHSTYVTVAFCHFRYSARMMLIHSGSTDTALEGDGGTYYITIRNNWIEYIGQRWPLARDSHVHLLNNYVSDYGISNNEVTPARMGDNVNPQTGVTNGMWGENNVVKVLTDGALDYLGATVTTNPTNSWFSPSGSNDGTPNMKVTGSLLIAGGANNPTESEVRPENVFTPPYTYEPIVASTAMRDWLQAGVGPDGAVRNQVSSFTPDIDVGLPPVITDGQTITVYTEDDTASVTDVHLYLGATDLGAMTEGTPGTWTLTLSGLTEDTTDIFFARVTTTSGTFDTQSMQAYVGEATVTPIDLVVADLTVLTTADTIALTQVHTLVVADLTVAVLTDTVTLTQVHTLVVADLAIATTIDSLTLTQTHNVAVSDLTVATTIDTVTITVDPINLAVTDATVAVVADTVSLTQNHILIVADLTVETTIEVPTLTVGSITLDVEDLDSVTTIDAVALSQTHNLTVADLTVASLADTVTVTQVHILAVADLTVASVMDSVTLTQVHNLSVADLAVASVFDAITLVQTSNLVVADATVASTIDTVSLTQAHNLVVADLTSLTTIEVPTLTVNSVTLDVEDLDSVVTVDAVTLTQIHTLAVADLTVATTVDTLTLSQAHNLVVADLTVASLADTIAITQVHTLDVEDATVVTTIDTVALTQVHSLVVADLTVASAYDTINLTQVHSLAVADHTVVTTIDTVTIAVGGISLTVADLTSLTTSDTVTLTQAHNLTIQDATVASTIDTVALTQTHTLAVADLTIEVVIDDVELEVGAVNLTVSDLNVSTTFDSISLTQTHILSVSDLNVTTTIDAVALTQVHDLVVEDADVLTTIDNVTLVLGPLGVIVTGTGYLTIEQLHSGYLFIEAPHSGGLDVERVGYAGIAVE